jgi:hypothetical protein
MSKSTQQTSFKQGGFISKSPLYLLTGLFVGFTLSAFSINASAEDTAAAPANASGRSASFQKRLDAEKRAEDQRDRDHAFQEQARLDELELRRVRAERAKQRNDAYASKQQGQQQPAPAQ